MTNVKRILRAATAVSVTAVVAVLTVCTGEESFDDSFNPDMAFVVGGAFMMGCTAEQGGDCAENEIPAREVTVEGFYAAKAPVTQFEWARLMGSEVIKWSVSSVGDDYPIHGISWNEANQYVKKLNAKTGKKYRLLTEAEWEYAARGGDRSGGYKYSGSDNINDVAWYSGNSGNRLREVCEKHANELGLCDMSGNVREWVSDAYGDDARVFRGGGWSASAQECRVSARNGASPSNRNKYIGLRVAVSDDAR